MSILPDKAAIQNSFAALPLSTYRIGETVITDGQLRLLPGMKAEPRQLSGAPGVHAHNGTVSLLGRPRNQATAGAAWPPAPG